MNSRPNRLATSAPATDFPTQTGPINTTGAVFTPGFPSDTYRSSQSADPMATRLDARRDVPWRVPGRFIRRTDRGLSATKQRLCGQVYRVGTGVFWVWLAASGRVGAAVRRCAPGRRWPLIHQKLKPIRITATPANSAVSAHWKGQYRLAGW